MFRKIPLTHWLAGILTLGVARACYYYYYIEDPNNFAYRYCSVGCGQAVKPGDPNYAQCCMPLSASAPTPATCTALASSAKAKGTMCSWSAVPTTDMQPTPPPVGPSTSKNNAMPTESCETTWVTKTASPTGCAAPSSPSVLPPPLPPPDSIASSSTSSSKLPAPTFTPVNNYTPPAPTAPSSSSSFSSYSASTPSTSEIKAMPTTSETPTTTSSATSSTSLEIPTAPSYEANTPTSFVSTSTSSTATTTTSSSASPSPSCSCAPRNGSAGNTPPPGFHKRTYGDDDCICEGEQPSPTPSDLPVPAPPVTDKTDLCPCADQRGPRSGSTGSAPKSPIARRGDTGEDLCPCEAESPAPPTPSEAPPVEECDCDEPRRGSAGAAPKNPIAKRTGGKCDCPSREEPPAEEECDCDEPRGGSAGAAPENPIAKRTGGKCPCPSGGAQNNSQGPSLTVPSPSESPATGKECDCGDEPARQGSAGSTPGPSWSRRRWLRRDGHCTCDQSGGDGAGAGTLQPEPIKADEKFDGGNVRRMLPPSGVVANAGPAAPPKTPALSSGTTKSTCKATGISSASTRAGESPSGKARRMLPPKDLQEDPAPPKPSDGDDKSTSLVKALPTSTPTPAPPAPSAVKCTTTMTTIITPACSPTGGIGGNFGGGAGGGDDGVNEEDLPECADDDEYADEEGTSAGDVGGSGAVLPTPEPPVGAAADGAIGGEKAPAGASASASSASSASLDETNGGSALDDVTFPEGYDAKGMDL